MSGEVAVRIEQLPAAMSKSRRVHPLFPMSFLGIDPVLVV